MRETTPLRWPEGWPRTMPETQTFQAQWKKSRVFYVDALELELKRIGTTSCILTFNESGSRDPGVAVWFSRKREEDFSWRTTLRITIAYPTQDDVQSAYRVLAAKYHTDNLTSGNLELFHEVAKAKQMALDWVNRREGNVFDYSIGADKFKEPKLNIAALANSIRYIRGLERCGTSAIMEKTFEGFKQLTEGKNVVQTAS